MPRTKYRNDLTADELKGILHYDPDTGDFTRQSSSNPKRWVGKKAGTNNGYGYIGITVKGVTYLAHRLAWLYVYGRWPSGEIDHINRDGLDNRICNLREATSSQQKANAKRRSDNSSGYKGVSWFQRDSCWRAYHSQGGKQVHLGYFSTKEDAYAAYCEYVRNRHGEFAHTPIDSQDDRPSL